MIINILYGNILEIDRHVSKNDIKVFRTDFVSIIAMWHLHENVGSAVARNKIDSFDFIAFGIKPSDISH